MLLTTQFRYHLRSAGTTCQGAVAVEVSKSREQLLERPDLAVAGTPDILRLQGLHPDHEHVLVVRAVEDDDLSLGGAWAWTPFGEVDATVRGELPALVHVQPRQSSQTPWEWA